MTVNVRAAHRKNIPVKKRPALGKEIGFFDVDSREMNECSKELKLQERMEPIAKILTDLYDFAAKFSVPFVFTTCCSGKFPEIGSLDYVCRVPMDSNDSSWTKDAGRYRYFYLQKKQYGNPRINSERCAHAFFKYNGNAMKLFKRLKMKKWVVFGNGFDLCVCHACFSLLKNGFKLVILEDAVMPAWGRKPIGTKENKKKILKELKGLGTEIMNTETFFKKYSIS
jgi:hypothetical protein